MQLSWHWPWVFLAGVIVVLAVAGVTLLVAARHKTDDIEDARTFSLDDDLNTESASRFIRQWRVLSRLAVILLVVALALATALVARPSTVDEGEEKASSRDIVLCLDVSGWRSPTTARSSTPTVNSSTASRARIGLSIFNSTSRTVFPLTDDYELVSKQLDKASSILAGVESQDDIDKMKDSDYQAISDWLEGTQNRKESTSLIGDGVVSCAANASRIRLRQRKRRQCRASARRIHRACHGQRRFRKTNLYASSAPGAEPDRSRPKSPWMDCFPDRSRARP